MEIPKCTWYMYGKNSPENIHTQGYVLTIGYKVLDSVEPRERILKMVPYNMEDEHGL